MGGFCGVVRVHSYNFDFRWIKILNFERPFGMDLQVPWIGVFFQEVEVLHFRGLWNCKKIA